MEYEEDDMVTSRELTTKAKMVDVIQRMPETATIEDAIYRLNVLKAVAEGLQDIEEGRIYDHDEVFDELLKDDHSS
jgi:predicted transcriptional regulator